MRGVDRRRTRSPLGSSEFWHVVGEPGIWDQADVTGISGRVSELMSSAWYAEAAEAAGVHAPELLADPKRAVHVLGGPAPVPAARNAVIQHFGTVGALIVVACEKASARASRDAARKATHDVACDLAGGSLEDSSPAPVEAPSETANDTVDEPLSRLLESFGYLAPAQLYTLLEGIEREDCHSAEDEAACARRWLNVAYAVAARDGTAEAHRAYVEALDRVLASTRPLVAS